LIHSTGHQKRLARDSILEAAPFGSATYSVEELVAEMGAAYLCAESGISPAVIANQAAYLAGWLKKWRARHFFSNQQERIMRRNLVRLLPE
jgi:antirestriction protein ArdC